MRIELRTKIEIKGLGLKMRTQIRRGHGHGIPFFMVPLEEVGFAKSKLIGQVVDIRSIGRTRISTTRVIQWGYGCKLGGVAVLLIIVVIVVIRLGEREQFVSGPFKSRIQTTGQVEITTASNRPDGKVGC